MSNQSPLQATNFDAIVCQAYSSTYRRLRQLEHKLTGELATHGFTLELAPVAKKVAAIAAAAQPEARLLLCDARPSPGQVEVA